MRGEEERSRRKCAEDGRAQANTRCHGGYSLSDWSGLPRSRPRTLLSRRDHNLNVAAPAKNAPAKACKTKLPVAGSI